METTLLKYVNAHTFNAYEQMEKTNKSNDALRGCSARREIKQHVKHKGLANVACHVESLNYIYMLVCNVRQRSWQT